MPQFRSFQARLLYIILGLLGLMQVAVFFAVNTASKQNATTQIQQDLDVGAKVFNRLLGARTRQLAEGAYILSSDFAFKQVIATQDHLTILSALENLGIRINAGVMVLTDLDHQVMADTLHPDERGSSVSFPGLMESAEENGQAAGIVFINKQAYQMVIVPLLAPEPIAWFCVGFSINEAWLKDLSSLILAEMSILHETVRETKPAQWESLATTLPANKIASLLGHLASSHWQRGTTNIVTMQDEDYVSFSMALQGRQNLPVIVAIQRSLDEALQPYYRLRQTLIWLFVTASLIFLYFGISSSRSVTRPVLRLVEGVREIQKGNYKHAVPITQQDEIGQLALAFNSMAKGLVERDRVRDLFGKVVSPAIAEELLGNKLELGGEERELSILFSDIRGFTSLSESRPPQEILSLLNLYLTRASALVDKHGGVVDKYIGDAVMALFGAPLKNEDDAARAVDTALETHKMLTMLNQEFVAQGLPELSIGIGINTGVAVAGNMGSLTRLNYTVIGDSVNLASRLEGLTKYYGVPTIVSEATMVQVPTVVFRELDRVCVKGKQIPITIYEPLGKKGDVNPGTMAEIEHYHNALSYYKNQAWEQALASFRQLLSKSDQMLYRIYIERIKQLIAHEPDKDWDGVFSYKDK